MTQMNDARVRGDTLKFLTKYEHALDFIIHRKLQFKKADEYRDEANIFYISTMGGFSLPCAEVSCFSWVHDNIYNVKMWDSFADHGNGVCLTLEDNFFSTPNKLYIENLSGERFYAILPQYISIEELEKRRASAPIFEAESVLPFIDNLHYFALKDKEPHLHEQEIRLFRFSTTRDKTTIKMIDDRRRLATKGLVLTEKSRRNLPSIVDQLQDAEINDLRLYAISCDYTTISYLGLSGLPNEIIGI